MTELTEHQRSMLEQFRAQCDRRGWFFLNASDLQEIDDVLALHEAGLIKISERDIRIDHHSGLVKAGEVVGVVVNSQP